MKNLIKVFFIITVLSINNTLFSQENTVMIRVEQQFWNIQTSNFTMYITDGESEDIITKSFNRRNEPKGEMMVELTKEINEWLKNGFCLITFDTNIIETGSRQNSITTVVLTKSKCSCSKE